MILSSLQKEARIILSDIHSIGVLLILPVAFMLIMTFAMSEQHNDIIAKTSVHVSTKHPSQLLSVYEGYIQKQGFTLTQTKQSSDIHIQLPELFDSNILTGLEPQSIVVNIQSNITPQKQKSVEELIKVALSKLRLHVYMIDSGDLDEDLSLTDQITEIEDSTNVSAYFKVNASVKTVTTPTLYSVPSWIIFGIYFIVLPVSITVINEKQNGTLIRLKTFPISSAQYFVSKFSAFYLLSIVQLIVLTLVGVFMVPIVTEQPDIVVNNWGVYILGGFFIVLAANALAFCVASVVNSYEQAIVLGGGINVLLAALSGFMVPIDILPDVMAEIATFSPLYWSAEVIRSTFIDKPLSSILPYLVKLFVFSCIAMSLASFLFINKIRKLTWN